MLHCFVNMIKKLFILFLIIVSLSKAKAQDLHLSMYDAAPLFLNPAMTGLFDGEWRVHAQHRTQWKSVNYKPYTTSLISVDKAYKKWGIGVQIARLKAGFGNYSTLQGLLSFSYSTPIDAKRYHNMSFGMQGGINQKSVEHELLSFDNQYSPNNGGSFNSSINNGEQFNDQTFYIPELNAGLMYYHAKQQSFLNPFVGISAFNLIKSNESFLDDKNKRENRYYFHAGTRINITELFYVLPKILIMKQGNFNEQTIAADVGYYLKNAEIHLVGGLIYRNDDAIVITIGAKKNSISGKIGYDINTSSLNSSTSGRGAVEISLTYIHKKKKKNAKICPRL